jgi:hypothetical protein
MSTDMRATTMQHGTLRAEMLGTALPHGSVLVP